MPELTLTKALDDRKLWPVMLEWSKKYFFDDQLQFLFDVRQNRPSDFLLANYLRDGAPKDVNLGGPLLKKIREAAALPKSSANSKKLAAALEEAYKEQLAFLTPTFSTGDQSFLNFDGYQKTLGQSSADPKVAAVLLALKLGASKSKQLAPLLTVYLHARTVSDAYKAYVPMLKIAAKAKLDPELTKAGKPVAGVERDYKVFKLAEALKPDVAEAKRYFESALATIKSKGKPSDPVEVNRMFSSGRMRTEKVTKNYLLAIKLDSAFATKFAAVAADKKKVDEQWAAYRKALGK